MNKPTCTLLAACLLCGFLPGVIRADDWPAWRGPRGNGVSQESDLPIRWSATENVKWRVELPERGNSTPIVCGGRVFLTQAAGAQRTVMCFDRADGKLIWQRGVATQLAEDLTHATNPYCSASPVTDGQRVIAWFGSDGLYCYDFDGKEIWSRDLGVQRHIWGYGASPVVWGDLCFLNFGPGERSFLIAVDKLSGKTIWRHDEETGYGKEPDGASNTPAGGEERAKGAGETGAKPAGDPNFIGSWTTPVIMKVEGQDQLLMSWPGRLAAYDPSTGREIWTCSGLNPLVYTSPIYSDDTVVAMGGFNGMSLAVRAGGLGDITDARRVWHQRRTKQRIGSGVIADGLVFIHDDPGVAECFDLATGKLVWEERLRGPGKTAQNWSSVMLAGDKCYSVNQGGDCFVFKAGLKFELLAVNSLGERSNASIAPSDGDLFIRTHAALWRIAVK